jgi:hypothetical protein
MKPHVGSKATHVRWFMPIIVLVDLFSSTQVYKTMTMYVFQNLSSACFIFLMDKGQDSKINSNSGGELIKCYIDL